MGISIHHRNSYDTHDTYDVFFFNDVIHTTVTHDPHTVSEWISDVKSRHRHRLMVGLDIEWRPFFKRHQNPVATLQLCVGRRCLIYQIIYARYIPESLDDFLSEENHTFVGVGVEGDLKRLKEDYDIGRCANAVELRKLAAFEYDKKELKNVGLKDLSSFVFGKILEKPKRVTLSKWDDQWLTDDQVKYACLDAFVSFEIGRVLYASD